MSVDTPSEKSPDSGLEVSGAPEPGFGWTHYAEQLNGRFAMIGFIALLVTELFAQQDFFTWIGLR